MQSTSETHYGSYLSPHRGDREVVSWLDRPVSAIGVKDLLTEVFPAVNWLCISHGVFFQAAGIQ